MNQFNTIETDIFTNQFGDNVHVYTMDYEITDNSSLIMFLREGDINTGDFEFADDYQFNGYYKTGSDLIDLCKHYGL